MPQIEALLDSIDVDSREYLFQELLLLELEFRAESGVQPRREEYARRFGEQRDLVDSVFVQFEEKRATLHRNVDDTHPPSVAATQESTRSQSADNRFDIVEEHAAGGLGNLAHDADEELGLGQLAAGDLVHHVDDGIGGGEGLVAQGWLAVQENPLPGHQHVVEDDDTVVFFVT